MRLNLHIRAVVLATLLPLGRPLAADSASPPLAALYARGRAACVEVLLDGRHSGSAWLADKEGSVLTAAHLFERPDPAPVLLLADNRRVTAKLVALDRGHDLALLQAASVPRGWPPLPVGRQAPAAGAELLQFGAPIFRSGLMQPGHVASDRTTFEFMAAITDYAEVVPLAAMMQGGTSGGPWLNRRGEVVGVQSSVMSLDGKPAGVAFMSPLQPVQQLLKARRSAATPTPGLGVDELWQQPADFLESLPPGTTGLVASVVRPGGPGALAGLQPRDVLLEADGQPLVRIADLPRIVRRHPVGDLVKIKRLRPGETEPRTVEVRLGCAEDIWAGEAPPARTDDGQAP